MPTVSFDAIVLTGGRGSRLGGVVKADLEVAGRRLLACDMPLVSADTDARLTGSLAEAVDCDGALLTDDRGRRQYLAAAYRTAALRDAVHALGPPTGQSMRRLVEGLRLRDVAAHPDEAMDCDSWPDVDRAVRLLEER